MRVKAASAGRKLILFQKSPPASRIGRAGKSSLTMEGPVELNTKSGRWVLTVAAAAVALLSGAVWLLALQRAGAQYNGFELAMASLFFLAFVVGGGSYAAWSALRFFSPDVVLTLPRATIPVGVPLEVPWRLNGRTDLAKSVTFTLEGEESAGNEGSDGYSVGDSSFTVKRRVFHRQLLSQSGGAACGPAIALQIPAGSMLSWKSYYNEVR